MFVFGLAGGADAQEQAPATDVGPRTEGVSLEDYQRTLYVVPAAADRAADGSQKRPFANLQAALATIYDAGPSRRYAVLVAKGRHTVVDAAMQEYVDLFGGFDAQDWSRDVEKNKTVLDAQKQGRVLIGANHARVDGFTITGGRARAHGGAVSCHDASPILTNNVFVDNGTQVPESYDLNRLHQGGNCGGAILIEFDGVPVVAHNLFVNNSTEIGDGGAIYCYEVIRTKRKPQPQILNNVFLANRTGVLDPTSQTRASSGGAIACSQGSSPLISGNVFVGNLVGDRSDGGALYCEYGAKPLIRGNRIVGNRAGDDGGGMYAMKMSEPVVNDNLFAANWTATGGVGGLRLSKEGRAIVTNNLFAHHQSGGGIASASSWMTCSHNTIVGNPRGGINYSNNYSYFAPSLIQNNLIYGNELEGIAVARGSKGALPDVSHNVVQGGFSGDDNVDIEPKFVRDGLSGKITDVRITEFTSILKLERRKLEPGKLTGRVIRIGEKWTVVKQNDAAGLVVWGNMTTDREGHGSNPTAEFTILPTFTQTADSPAKNVGAHVGDRLSAKGP
jgi:hypothetical protein